MRLFVAVNLPEAAREDLRKGLTAIQQRSDESGSRIKWVQPERMHFTLTLLGECAEDRVPEITRALQGAVAEAPSFSLIISGFGCFPPLGKPGVLWIGCTQGQQLLIDLAGKIETACQALGFSKENRSFSPHLTLGRVQAVRHGERLRSELASLPAFSIGPIQITSVDLVQSVLSQEGPRYTTLQRVALR